MVLQNNQISIYNKNLFKANIKFNMESITLHLEILPK
jgi:hypothetical protein